jgi:hypothetical protein
LGKVGERKTLDKISVFSLEECLEGHCGVRREASGLPLTPEDLFKSCLIVSTAHQVLEADSTYDD